MKLANLLHLGMPLSSSSLVMIIVGLLVIIGAVIFISVYFTDSGIFGSSTSYGMVSSSTPIPSMIGSGVFAPTNPNITPSTITLGIKS